MSFLTVVTYPRSYSLFFRTINTFFRKRKQTIFLFWNPANLRKIGPLVLKLRKKWDVLLTMQLFVSEYLGLPNRKYLILHDNLTFEEEFIFGEKRNDFDSLNKMITSFVDDAKHIFTVSNYSRIKLINQFSLVEEKISVIYPQIDYLRLLKILLKEDNSLKVYSSFKFSEFKYNMIFIGSSHFRKNVKSVFEVYKELNAKISDKIRLFVVSSPREDIPVTYEVYQEMKEYPGIIQLQYVNENILYSLIHHSDLFILPTLEEGFGMPNIEAQLCKTAVVSSNVSCIPEVLGNSAVLCDPFDIDDMVDQCLKILTDYDYRKKLVSKGFENGLKYTNYEKEYQKIIDIINS